MDFIRGFDRNQLVMMDFEANVDHDSRARVVDWFVEALPVHELGFYDVLQSECPANQVLHTNGHICKKRKHRVKRYYTKSCAGCSLREKCTKNKIGRFIERSIYQEALEENEKRVNQNPEYYRQRQQITEHQFGTLKRQWGFTFT